MNQVTLFDFPGVSGFYDVFAFPTVTAFNTVLLPVLRASGVGPGSRVLEIGAGTGMVARAVASGTGAEVVGVDRSPSMLAVARLRNGGVTYIQGDAVQLGRVVGGKFDAVVANYLLRHLSPETLQPLFSEVAVVTKGGGLFVVNDLMLPNVGAPDMQRLILGVWSVYGMNGIIRTAQREGFVLQQVFWPLLSVTLLFKRMA